ncbi:Proclavaminate amidinohydrolase [Nonomuraea coxensis DSM 45129]|uniref:Proclavaminate amidinohydrolase n=1 Tax=Nonomuraea coxensis DSM 45129 TaxID=1122611 RepID=A0ABX8TUK1_9ACTN|nr:arginase family protein [Nonomuraea coxensis]QYC39032.1 Proclavaminate amidinohydrolase [Nonomuraea coxensis DSM 45129]
MTGENPAGAPWVLNPAFLVQGGELVNPAEGVRLALTPPLRELWEGRDGVRITEEAEDVLRRVRLIVPPAASSAATGGLARPAATPLSLPAGARAGAAVWGLIGAPLDLGGPPGPRPKDAVPVVRDALSRRFRLLAEPAAYAWTLRAGPGEGLAGVVDHGDLLVDPRTDTGVTAHERLRALVRAVLAQGHRPLVIGGDHAVSYPAVGAVADAHPELRVVHFDAHADRRPIGESATADCGNFVSWLLAEHPRLEWLTIGVRGVDTRLDLAASPREERVSYLTADETRAPQAAGTIARFCAGRPVYLTVDIDVLDPVYAPDVVYPSSGGLDPETLAALVRNVIGAGRLVAGDLVEACPSPAGRHTTAMRLADLVEAVHLAEAALSLERAHV